MVSPNVSRVVIALTLLLAGFSVLSVLVARYEVHECRTWQARAMGTQFAPWQYSQCDAYHISI